MIIKIYYTQIPVTGIKACKVNLNYLLRSAFVMLTSSRRQNLNRGANDFILHLALRSLLPRVLGTSCSISELRHDDESSPWDRALRPPRKLTHPHPSDRENIVGLLSFLYFFLSLCFRVHLGVFWRDLGMVTSSSVLSAERLRNNHTSVNKTKTSSLRVS